MLWFIGQTAAKVKQKTIKKVAILKSGGRIRVSAGKAYISLAQTNIKGFGIEALHCPRSVY